MEERQEGKPLPPGVPVCKSQDFRKANGPLIRLSFFFAQVYCRMNPMIYGYARVSTGGQSEAARVRQLRTAGAGKVFREVASGAKTDRPQLRRLLAEISPATW